MIIFISVSDIVSKVITVSPSVDTKAAHLERSQVKAALQQLQMRVMYQWSTAAQGVASGLTKPKPKRLDSYFLK